MTDVTLTQAEWDDIACACHESICPIHNEQSDCMVKINAAELMARIERILAARTPARDAEVEAAYLRGLSHGRSERDDAAEAREAEWKATVERVKALHRPDGGIDGPGAICVECTIGFGEPWEEPVAYPCATRAALTTPPTT